MDQQEEMQHALQRMRVLRQRINRHLSLPTVSPLHRPPKPPPRPTTPSLQLPRHWFPQRGSNCRQVALGNVLRLAAEPSMKDMEPFLLAITKEQLPSQLPALKGHLRGGINAAEWTRGWSAFTGLMTFFIEAKWPGVVAIQAARMQWGKHHTEDQRDAFSRAFGGTQLQSVQVQDRQSPGFLYFTKSHCMSCVQDEDGQWWDVPKSTASKVTPHNARNKFQRASGVVAILSFATVRQLVRLHLQTAMRDCPLFLARLGQRILQPTTDPSERRLLQWVFQTPRSAWDDATRQALQKLVLKWWQA